MTTKLCVIASLRSCIQILRGGLLGLALGLSAASASEGDGFIPLDDLFRSHELGVVKLSPAGKHLVGQRLEEVRLDDWRVLTFVFDLEGREIALISDGLDNAVTYLDFVSDDRLVLGHLRGSRWRGRHWVVGSGGWRTVDVDGSNPLVIIPPEDALGFAGHANESLTNSRLLGLLWQEPDHALFSVRRWNRGYRETATEGGPTGRYVYRINVHTAEAERVAQDTKNAINWWLDRDGIPALSLTVPDATLDRDGFISDPDWEVNFDQVLYLVEDGRQTRRLPIAPTMDPTKVTFTDPYFSRNRDALYFRSQAYSDRIAIVAMDLATFDVEIIHEDPESDIERLYHDPMTGELIGYYLPRGRGDYVYLDSEIRGIMERVNASLHASVNGVVAFDRDRRRFLIHSTTSDFPAIHYLLDTEAGRLEEALNPAPWLNDYTFSPIRPISYKARDGERIDGYLTLPHNAELVPPYPMILLVHGGPWVHDRWEYSPEVQFYADRGYAVLQVNYRGSTGRGLRFLELGRRQIGKSMQDDLTDAVHWAIAEGHADPERVGIAGASYGAYAAMAGLAFTPELYRVGIAFSGLYDLARQISDDAKYEWHFAERFWSEWAGHPDEDRAALHAVSPMFHTKSIQAPVFLYHGMSDRVTRINQAFDFARALRRSRVEFTRFYRRTEGHGVSYEENRIELYERLERFLRQRMPSDLLN